MSSIKWLLILFLAVAVAGVTYALARLFHWERTIYIEAIILASLVMILVSLLGFLSKLRE